jgi:hypothetical protein
LRLGALVGLVMPLALPAYAATTVSPTSGTAEPGETITATVHVEPTLLSLSLVGVSSDPVNITASFNPTIGGGGGLLGGDPWDSVMTVTVGPQTAPGDYTITITDLDLLGGPLYTWPLTVTAPPTTTTTSSTTTTTTTTSPTTTTTSPTTTTTSGTPTTTSDDTPTTTSGNSPTTTSGSSPTTTSASSPTTTDRPASTLTTRDDSVVAMPVGGPSDPGSLPGDGPGATSPTQSDSAFSEVALSSGLIDSIGAAVPTFVANAFTSPFVVLEILLRALGRTVTGLLIPIVLMLLFGLLLFWRLRPQDEDWETDVVLDDSFDLPEAAS